MKKLMYIFLFFAIQQMVSQKKMVLEPIIKKQGVRMISGSQNTYYPINSSFESFDVSGYDELIIYSRERIVKKAAGYQINYKFLKSEEKSYAVSKKRKDYRSAFADKTINKYTTIFNKRIVKLTNNKTFFIRTDAANTVDVKLIGVKNKKHKLIKPIKSLKPVRIIKGKLNKYYKLNSKIPTLIETDKEGELIVYTRMRITDDYSNNYTFTYQSGDSIHTVSIRNVKKSSHAIYASIKIKETPSTYNKTVIKVNDIYKKIVFSSTFPIDARFVFKKIIKKNGWEELESKHRKIVPLIVRKKKTVRDYTRITHNDPFNFTITNSSEIKILIRGEFQYDMHANNDYEIVLKDNGKIVHTYRLSCNRSNVLYYKYNNDLIPGTLDKFIIKVPKGTHKYSISINNKDKTALIRILKKDAS